MTCVISSGWRNLNLLFLKEQEVSRSFLRGSRGVSCRKSHKTMDFLEIERLRNLHNAPFKCYYRCCCLLLKASALLRKYAHTHTKGVFVWLLLVLSWHPPSAAPATEKSEEKSFSVETHPPPCKASPSPRIHSWAWCSTGWIRAQKHSQYQAFLRPRRNIQSCKQIQMMHSMIYSSIDVSEGKEGRESQRSSSVTIYRHEMHHGE